jgi:guanine nucleotide-binding protein alpha-1 subunit
VRAASLTCRSFLNDLDRLTSLHYCPSDGTVSFRSSCRRVHRVFLAEDVFRARLKTIGVCEHKFEMESGFESGTEWRIIDVGGSRSQVRQPPCPPCRLLTTCLALSVPET